jgi:hypothetical protein
MCRDGEEGGTNHSRTFHVGAFPGLFAR